MDILTPQRARHLLEFANKEHERTGMKMLVNTLHEIYNKCVVGDLYYDFNKKKYLTRKEYEKFLK